MEPADKKNKDHSHVAHKMKRKPMKFENGNGKYITLKISYYALKYILLCFTALPCPTYKVENGWTKNFRNFVYHGCRWGYQLFGSVVRKCLLNGAWSGNTPVCIRKGMPLASYDSYIQCS